MRSATYLRSYRGKQNVKTVGKAMTSQHGGGTQPAGIRDVARLAGVSVASVSFALNGQPGVADDTRQRILAAAAQLGYRANTQAQALRRGRTTTYGLVIRNFSNPFFLEVLTGAERAASDAGATLLLLDSHYSADREHLLVREMAAQRLAGLAIAPVGKGESLRLWQELRPGTPVVALNAAVEGIPGVSRVYPDNAAGVELAMRRLADLGHSCVAFLSAPRGLVADPDRLRHFRRLARVLGLRPVVMRSPLTITDGHPQGVFHSMTVADDFEIADLNFRVDSITHPFDGDLAVMPRSPAGIGVDLISLIAAPVDAPSRGPGPTPARSPPPLPSHPWRAAGAGPGTP